MSAVQDAYKFFVRGVMWKATSYTREKGSWAWAGFWKLLICSGFQFEKDDLIELEKWCEQDSWRVWHPPGERHYNLAVYDSNVSFASAYEIYIRRKPFIFTDIDYPHHRGGYVVHGGGSRKRGRLVIGAQFPWIGERVEVTSFKDDGQSLVACDYKLDQEGFRGRKIKRRFVITRDDLIKVRKAGDGD